MSTLDKVREENATENESKTYYSILRTCQLIPFDSAIFLSTDELPNDTEHRMQASMYLLKKRIRLYLILFDNKKIAPNETSSSLLSSYPKEGFLSQLATKTGNFIHFFSLKTFESHKMLQAVISFMFPTTLFKIKTRTEWDM
jgi:hypothetical protein